MTRAELEARIATLEAQKQAMRAPIDLHNDDVGWWGRLTGDGIDLREYQPMRGGLAMNAMGAGIIDKGDKPEYYDLTRELYDFNQQLAALKQQEEASRIQEQKQAALSGKTLAEVKPATTTPTQGTKLANTQAVATVERPRPPAQEAVTPSYTTPSYSTGNRTVAKNTPATPSAPSAPKKVKPTYKQNVTVPQVAQQSGNAQSMEFGTDYYVVPSNGFTSDTGVYGAPITIDPVNFHGDNGGLQHAAMNALYQNTPATFGQMLAFSNLMQGRRDLGGGIGAVTKTMQDLDKMNAYSAQSNVAGRVQDLLSKGYDMNEARYLALSEYGLQNGYDRMALGATMPEYAKFADERAKREMDALAASGGAYQSSGAFGYTPRGVNSFHSNGDGTMDMVVNGQKVTNVPMEYGLSGVYAAIKGDGSGASNAASRWVNEQDKAWQYGSKLSDNDVAVAKLQYAGATPSKEDTFTKYYNQELGKALGKAAGSKQGNKSGFVPSY